MIAVQPVFWTMPTQLLSGTALAAGIGFVNLFGAIGGFLAPIVRVQGRNVVRQQRRRTVNPGRRRHCRGGHYLFIEPYPRGTPARQRTALNKGIAMNALLSNPFKRGLLRGETQIGLWLSSTLILHGGDRCDVGIRLAADRRRACPEHYSGPLSSAAGDCPLCQPAGHSRPVEGNRSLIKQVLDIGARTLLVPMVDTAEQAREVVSATRYPPIGSRGVGAGVARAARWGRVENYMAEANDQLCLLIQVESRTALENLDAILEVDGIDGVFIGPADLSASLGYPDDAGHPDVQRVIGAEHPAHSRGGGKAAGFLAVDPAMAEKCLAWGPTCVAVGVDTMLYTQALDRRLAMFKSASAQPQEKTSY